MSLGTWGRAGRDLTLEGLFVSQGGQLFKKRPAVGEKAFEPCAQVVQPVFTIGRPENAILRAPSVTKFEEVTVPAIAGQGVPFELSEFSLSVTFEQIDQSGPTDIPEVVLPVNEVIASIEISIVLDHGNVTTGFLKDAQGVFLPQSRFCSFLEDLDSYLLDVPAHPLIKDGAEKSAESLRGRGQRAYTSIDVRPGLHQGEETDVCGSDLLKEPVNLVGVVDVVAVHHAKDVTCDSVPTQKFISAHGLAMGRSSAFGKAMAVMHLLRSVQADAHAEALCR
jgi:hypothetical protein